MPAAAGTSGIRRGAGVHKEIRMADDTKKTGLDRKLISLEEPHEVRSWTQSLGVSEMQLRDAVKAVGNSAEAVRKHLADGKR
jgi:hypothetical protein